MSDRSAKQLVERVLARLPDDATMDDVQYSLYVAELVERRGALVDEAAAAGVDEAIRAGRLIPHEDVVHRMARWLQKSSGSPTP